MPKIWRDAMAPKESPPRCAVQMRGGAGVVDGACPVLLHHLRAAFQDINRDMQKYR